MRRRLIRPVSCTLHDPDLRKLLAILRVAHLALARYPACWHLVESMQALLSRSRPSVIWPLRVIAAACLIGPLLLFAYSSLTSYRAINRQASERLERALDVLQEHAHKALQTIERSIAETNEVLRGLSDEEIRADQLRISERLKRIGRALPQMEAVWAFDRDGRPLVSSTVVPVPTGLNNSDRDYFRGQAEADSGTYIGDVVQARIGSKRFFVVSGRRTEASAGDFNGVVAFTVVPEHFREFYARLARGVADSFGLIRADGAFLARFPQVLDRPRHREHADKEAGCPVEPRVRDTGRRRS